MTRDLLHDVVAADHAGGYRLRLRFEDGVEGQVDLREVVSGFRGLLRALEDPAYVAKVAVSDHGTVEWPNGVELDPIVLYCAAKGIPVPDFGDAPKPRRKAGQGRARRTAAGGVTRRANRRTKA